MQNTITETLTAEERAWLVNAGQTDPLYAFERSVCRKILRLYDAALARAEAADLAKRTEEAATNLAEQRRMAAESRLAEATALLERCREKVLMPFQCYETASVIDAFLSGSTPAPAAPTVSATDGTPVTVHPAFAASYAAAPDLWQGVVDAAAPAAATEPDLVRVKQARISELEGEREKADQEHSADQCALATEKAAHEREKREHERTWDLKARAQDDLATARANASKAAQMIESAMTGAGNNPHWKGWEAVRDALKLLRSGMNLHDHIRQLEADLATATARIAELESSLRFASDEHGKADTECESLQTVIAQAVAELEKSRVCHLRLDLEKCVDLALAILKGTRT